jgi:serine O-acetyltransferase
MMGRIKNIIYSGLTTVFFLLRKKDLWVVKEKCNVSKNKISLNIYQRIYEKILFRNNCWIGYDSIFKSKPIFPHGYHGVFISRLAKIGKNCVIFHQVTIGSDTLKGSTIGAPEIGDNVYIGAGAKIIGNIKIGNNCRIGANCVVTEDVESNSVVVLPKARIIKKDIELDNRFFTMRNNSKGEKVWLFFDGINWTEEDIKYNEDSK